MLKNNHRTRLSSNIFNNVLEIACNAAFEELIPSDDLVSVIIPSYNHENYIEATLASINNQTYTKLEIILVDDESSDDTFTVALKCLKEMRLPYLAIRKSNEKRPAVSINGAIQLAYGAWVTMLASDDIYYPEKIASQLLVAQQAKADVVLGYAGQMTEEGIPLLVSEKHVQDWLSQAAVLCQNKSALRFQIMTQQFSPFYIGWFISRKAISVTGVFDTDAYTEDYEFNIRLCDPRLSLSYTKQITGLHRQTRGRLSLALIDVGKRSFLQLIDKHASSWIERRKAKAAILVNVAFNKRSFGYPISAAMDLAGAIGYAPVFALEFIYQRLISRFIR